MKVVVDEIKNQDETYSYSGTKDFIQPETDVRSLQTKVPAAKPRTRKSVNNSYT